MVIFYTSSADLCVVKEELLPEELPSILRLPAESRCFMYTRLSIVVSLKHQHAADNQLLKHIDWTLLAIGAEWLTV